MKDHIGKSDCNDYAQLVDRMPDHPAKLCNNKARFSGSRKLFSVFVTKTMIHANNRTTIVRIAVATVESVSLIPHFANMEVIPAKKRNQTQTSTT